MARADVWSNLVCFDANYTFLPPDDWRGSGKMYGAKRCLRQRMRTHGNNAIRQSLSIAYCTDTLAMKLYRRFLTAVYCLYFLSFSFLLYCILYFCPHNVTLLLQTLNTENRGERGRQVHNVVHTSPLVSVSRGCICICVCVCVYLHQTPSFIVSIVFVFTYTLGPCCRGDITWRCHADPSITTREPPHPHPSLIQSEASRDFH